MNRPQNKLPIDNIVIAIDATTKKGLIEVFIGEYSPVLKNSNKYQWVNKVQVFLAEGHEPSKDRYIHLPSILPPSTPVEKIQEPRLRLVKDIQKEK